MVGQDDIVVFLTGTSSDDFISAVSSAPENAIIVHYSPQKNLLTRIGGKRGNAARLPSVIMAINYQELTQYIDKLAMSSIRNGNFRQLKSLEWSLLREAIIRAVPDLRNVIEALENVQLRQPVIDANSAVVYDTFHSIIEIFNPQGKNSLNEILDQWREQIVSQAGHKSAETPTDLITSLGDAIRSHPIVSSAGTIDEQIDQVIKDRTDELDNATYDARTGFPEMEIDPDQPLNETVFKFRFIDREASQRKLTIYLVHQKGLGRTDLLGSDLIYLHHANRSIVFVQHKRFKNNNTWHLSLDDKQLKLMLETCMSQEKCYNYVETDKNYLSSSEMRLYDCPAFYKLLKHNAQIDAGTRASLGIYVQACRARQLVIEHDSTITRDIVWNNGLTLTAFSELLRKAQLGSRSVHFEKLQRRILAHLKGEFESDRIFAFAEETTL